MQCIWQSKGGRRGVWALVGGAAILGGTMMPWIPELDFGIDRFMAFWEVWALYCPRRIDDIVVQFNYLGNGMVHGVTLKSCRAHKKIKKSQPTSVTFLCTVCTHPAHQTQTSTEGQSISLEHQPPTNQAKK